VLLLYIEESVKGMAAVGAASVAGSTPTLAVLHHLLHMSQPTTFCIHYMNIHAANAVALLHVHDITSCITHHQYRQDSLFTTTLQARFDAVFEHLQA
jgi:hypothetical protein